MTWKWWKTALQSGYGEWEKEESGFHPEKWEGQLPLELLKLFNTFSLSLSRRVFSPGFRDTTLWLWFPFYVTDWSFSFFADASSTHALDAGVSQGWIFGFILFSVYSVSLGILILCKDFKYHPYDQWFPFFQLCPSHWIPDSKIPLLLDIFMSLSNEFSILSWPKQNSWFPTPALLSRQQSPSQWVEPPSSQLFKPKVEGSFLISLFPSSFKFSKSDWFYVQNIFQTCILPAMATDTTLLETLIIFHLSSFFPTVASVRFKEHKSDWEALTLKTLQRLSIAVKIESRLVRANNFLHEVGPCLSLTATALFFLSHSDLLSVSWWC